MVEDSEISRIRSLEQRWLEKGESGPGHSLSSGEQVSIVSGAFAGFSGVIKQLKKGKTHAIISVSGSPIEFEISCCLLEKDQA